MCSESAIVFCEGCAGEVLLRIVRTFPNRSERSESYSEYFRIVPNFSQSFRIAPNRSDS
jgi:hypothetical protein